MPEQIVCTTVSTGCVCNLLMLFLISHSERTPLKCAIYGSRQPKSLKSTFFLMLRTTKLFEKTAQYSYRCASLSHDGIVWAVSFGYFGIIGLILTFSEEEFQFFKFIHFTSSFSWILCHFPLINAINNNWGIFQNLKLDMGNISWRLCLSFKTL